MGLSQVLTIMSLQMTHLYFHKQLHRNMCLQTPFKVQIKFTEKHSWNYLLLTNHLTLPS